MGESVFTESDFAEIESGYTVWLEPSHLHFNSGGQVEIKALWGNKMQKDGTGNPQNWQAVVIPPAGEEFKGEVSYGEGLYQSVSFPAGEEGLYYVLVENNAGTNKGTSYIQRAGLLVPVGHHVHGHGVATGRGLEIVPSELKEFHPGDNISLQVLFNGQTLPNIDVKITYHLYEGDDYPYSATTGDSGNLSLTFKEKGHWMFLAQYKDQNDLLEYHVSTFVVPGVR